MTLHHRLFGSALLAACLLIPSAAHAQEEYTFTVGLLGGLGGSIDADPGNSLDNTGYQLNLAMITEPRTHVGVRLGRLNLDSDQSFGSLTDAELSYATVAGEYRLPESWYESGLYIGLGGYRLKGVRDFQDHTENAIGLSVGVTGEFPVTKWLGLLVELSGHYVDFDEQQLFAMGHAGVAIHF